MEVEEGRGRGTEIFFSCFQTFFLPFLQLKYFSFSRELEFEQKGFELRRGKGEDGGDRSWKTKKRERKKKTIPSPTTFKKKKNNSITMGSLVAAPPHPSVTFPRLLLASADAQEPSFAGWVGSDSSGEDLWLRLEPQRSNIDGGGDDDENENARRPPPSLRTSRLLLSPALQRALRGHEDAVAARLRQSRNASEFFSELKTLLEAVGVASSSSSGSWRKRRGRGSCEHGGGSCHSPSSSFSPLSSSFYSALLERLGPRAWNSMTAMREARATAEGCSNNSGGEVLLSFAVPASSNENAPPASPAPAPLRVTLALDPATFPRSAPRVASVDLPSALLRPPLALLIASWWNKGSSNSSIGNPTTSSKTSKIDDVLCWLLTAAGSRAASAAFAALDQLDARAWVLDPPLPAVRARTSRRIAAAEGGRVSVEVDFANFFTFSPSSSSMSSSSLSFLPAPRFGAWLGPEALVFPLREAAEASAMSCAWDPSKGAVENLEVLLRLSDEGKEGQRQQLPRKPGSGSRSGGAAAASEAEKEEDPVGLGDGAECAICCAYRLKDDGGDGGERGGRASTTAPSSFSLPSVSCENERCGRPFHASCLREWLIAAAGGGGEKAAGAGGGGGGGAVVRGECPYCCEPISVQRK